MNGSDNGIGDEGGVALGQGLATNSFLKQMILESEYDVTVCMFCVWREEGREKGVGWFCWMCVCVFDEVFDDGKEDK